MFITVASGNCGQTSSKILVNELIFCSKVKGESQNGGIKKTKYVNFSENRTFQGVRNVYFSENLEYFNFCNLSFVIRIFALLPTS